MTPEEQYAKLVAEMRRKVKVIGERNTNIDRKFAAITKKKEFTAEAKKQLIADWHDYADLVQTLDEFKMNVSVQTRATHQADLELILSAAKVTREASDAVLKRLQNAEAA